MAVWIRCGEPHYNERDALGALCKIFPDEWALLTNLPRYLVDREIDACLVGPDGIVVLELKNYRGEVTARPIGSWTGIAGSDRDKNPLEQASKCAQRLKSYLVGRVPALDRRIYVEGVVILTHPLCKLSLGDPSLSDCVGRLADATVVVRKRLLRLRRAHRWVGALDFETLQQVFAALTLELPLELAARWKGPSDARTQAGPRLVRATDDRSPPSAATVAQAVKAPPTDRIPTLAVIGAMVLGVLLIWHWSSASRTDDTQLASAANTTVADAGAPNNEFSDQIAAGTPPPLEYSDSPILWNNSNTDAWNCGDINCLTNAMNRSGATQESVDFAALLTVARRAETPAWAQKYVRYGPVDLVFYNCAACRGGGFAMFNGTSIVVAETEAGDRLQSWFAGYRRTISGHPNMSLTYYHAFLGERPAADGGQRFAFLSPIADCEACDPIAAVEYTFEFDNRGNLANVTVVGSVPGSAVRSAIWGIGN